MKTLKQEKNGNTQVLEVELSWDQFRTEREKVINNYAKDMSIPGFRKGKAPKEIVEKNLNIEVVNDRTSQNLISDAYPVLLKENNVDPVDYPKVEIITLKEENPFVFKLEIDVYPEVLLGQYKGIKVQKKTTEVTEEEVAKVISDLQTRVSKFVDVENGSTKKDDNLFMELEAKVEGAEVKSWPRGIEHFPLGKNFIHEEFDKSIEGLNCDEEKSFRIKFPEDYSLKEIAGKNVDFKIKIKKIQRKELVPLDDDFAKKVGNFGSFSELKEDIKINMENEKKEDTDADLKNQIIQAVSKETKVELPTSLIDAETDIMVDELKTSLSRSNLTLENYLKSIRKTEDEIKSDLRKPATSRALGKVILKKVAQVEKLEVPSHDLDTEIALMAQGSNKSVEEYKRSLSQGALKYMEDYILRRKALDFLISHANIN
ncbi:trigger factor [candidate division WOR-1 bacterium RIFOXYC2_FULL_37_10]|uniref:Trigger factor n=1 Tax=candidate division WOR-1 bacterium RIFOXYB2_FULL_37_13 TaxID=1802579 RepID=A0A1F4SXI1_UNCSA|nr:MAG: trigger factor [candidate division WOR-1 bacterium RIFOXYA2_FULL_37_7]OGC25139.1 MAG: trigger factor [candidate division WOR-1 bacterium RIFOXYB2_FULL_37_13]OGC36313.1 MAG: trigger factor [candidate division WOR-1 bacterium RIFOXYC2_FULL_37_10]